ncbi:hypothetical protein RUND412_008611 [Rhizina undulata]
MSSPTSTLSTFSSMDSPPPPPPPLTPRKRLSTPSDHSPLAHHNHHPAPGSDISSDTSGSVPGSPMDLDEEHTEQVSICRWNSCNMDLGNMDDLVKHIHDEHIGTRKAKYACEWDDCSRKGMAHASGYALRAHMRSHTKEKPFYCTLPECDRSFTRSDALAKHMRTVHETEALRPSDPIPKSHPNHPHNVASAAYAESVRRRRALLRNLDLSTHQRRGSDGSQTETDSELESYERKKRRRRDGDREIKREEIEEIGYYQPEDGFDPDEETHPPKVLERLLKRKLAWAESQNEELREEVEMLEKRRREAWIKKEVLLERVLGEELGEDARALSLKKGGG